ncbi:MAG: GMC family oxidoreductase [Chromatiales bacterium]|nr:GMC family oxidoreductase [Chromatiales bacterium]
MAEQNGTERPDADVVVIGAGIVGATAAWRLATAGVSVLMVDAGAEVDRGKALFHFRAHPENGVNAPYDMLPSAPYPTLQDSHYVNAGPDEFIGSYTRVVGGTSWHWTGFGTRFFPADFQSRSRYGVGEDWPLGYDDMVPYYRRIEQFWGVAGPAENAMDAPRDTPYPMPEIPLTYLDRQVAEAAHGMGLTVRAWPHLRNSELFDDRPPCCGNATCVPICPIGAKLDGAHVVNKARKAGATLLNPATVFRLVADGAGRITEAHYMRPDGVGGILRARHFIVACHAIETPRLLLLSGIANSSDAVGRYLMSQGSIDSRALVAKPVWPYRGPTTTGGIWEHRDGEERKQRAAIGISMLNRGFHAATGPIERAAELIHDGLTGHALTERLSDECSREVALNVSAETLPNADNRVTLSDRADASGLPRPQVFFRMDDYTRDGLAFGVQIQERILRRMGATEVDSDGAGLSVAIMAGSTRMGSDPTRSVVDSHCRSHDHANLWILGTSVFPTAPVSPPTVTAGALALRAADRLLEDLRPA